MGDVDGQPAPVLTHRVLVLSADMGGGHNATAAALTEQVMRRWPGSQTSQVDVLDLLGQRVAQLFRSIYVGNVEYTPWLYEFFYASLWRHRRFAEAAKRLTGSWCGRRLIAPIDRFDPDLIVSTYPIGSSGLAWLRRHRGLAVPTGAWISDFAPHPLWVYRELDVNFVMHEVTAANARVATPGARVEVCRLPVTQNFRPGDQGAARNAAGLDPDAFVVAVSCGSYSFGDLADTVSRLLATGPQVQVVAVCGHDDITRAQLLDLDIPPERLSVRGWERDMPNLFVGADLVLTNAGGATALEALACGAAVLMYSPIAAHGRANADLMAASGLAETCEEPAQLTSRVRTLMTDRSAVQTLQTAALDHVRRVDLDDGLAGLAAIGVNSRDH